MQPTGSTPVAAEAMDMVGRWKRVGLGGAVVLALGIASGRVMQQPAWPDRFAAEAVSPRPPAVAASAPLSASPSVPPAAPTPQFVSREPGAAVHAATLLPLADGRLRAAWFSGSREGAADVEIRTAVYDPTAAVWSAEETALTRSGTARDLARSVKKLGNPVLARAPGGHLHLYVVTVSLGGWAGSSITRWESRDEGRTWARPRRLVSSPFLNLGTLVKGKPVAYPDGGVGLPVYHELITKYPEWLRLDAAGTVLDRIRLPASERSLQPVLLVHDATRAELMMRHAADGTPARITRARTLDAGRSWSPVEATPLPNPNAAVVGIVTTRGDRLLVFNDSETDRGNLTLAVAAPTADGEASNWQRLARLEGESSRLEDASAIEPDYLRRLADAARATVPANASPPGFDPDAVAAAAARQLCYADPAAAPARQRCNFEYSYPSLVEAAPGDFHLVYTWHRTRIKHLRFHRGWIDAQRALSASAPPR
jgi:predicted neuraminidase